MASIPSILLKEANACHHIRGRVRRDAQRAPLVHDGEVVGFVTERSTMWGTRLGPIYVMPKHRRRGLLRAFYASRPHDLFVAFVADDNEASREAHKRCGFVNWRRGNGGWFMRRGPTGPVQT